jgi:hypothetical protein
MGRARGAYPDGPESKLYSPLKERNLSAMSKERLGSIPRKESSSQIIQGTFLNKTVPQVVGPPGLGL